MRHLIFHVCAIKLIPANEFHFFHTCSQSQGLVCVCICAYKLLELELGPDQG